MITMEMICAVYIVWYICPLEGAIVKGIWLFFNFNPLQLKVEDLQWLSPGTALYLLLFI